MLDSGRNTILLPHFGSLSGEVPPVLPFLCLCFKRLVVVRVDGGGIIDLGRDRDRDHFVGNDSCHCLSYVRDEAPEDIRSYGRSGCVFVSFALISSRPSCHCLLVPNTARSDKLLYLSREYTALDVGHKVKQINISFG